MTDVVTIRFENPELGINVLEWYEYRTTAHSAVISGRSWNNPQWALSVIFRTLDEVRAFYGRMPGFIEVPVVVFGDPTAGKHSGIGAVFDNGCGALNPTPDPLHKCYCSWDKVYRDGCSCGGI